MHTEAFDATYADVLEGCTALLAAIHKREGVEVERFGSGARAAGIWYNAGVIMEAYLDNCRCNRPFDQQTDLRVGLETI